MSVGANMEVLLDGKPMPFVTSVSFQVSAKNVAKVKLEMYAEVEIEGNFSFKKKKKSRVVKSGGKTLVLHELGSYVPKCVAEKKG